jgi:hypothetical protein
MFRFLVTLSLRNRLIVLALAMLPHFCLVRPGKVAPAEQTRGRGEICHQEPISKLPEEDQQASELDEAEEVLGVELPADE